VAAIYQPAGEGNDVGGDFYDVFSVEEGQWFVVIGDVCGKGAEAAAVTALARYTIRAAAVRRRSPTHILRWLNDVMLRETTTDGRFVTIAILRLDIGAELGATRVTAASGGHPLPRVVRAGGALERLGTAGTLIGVVPDVELADHVSELNTGDTIVAFTDGLSEASAPERVWSPEDTDEAIARAGSGGPDPADLLRRLLADAIPEGRAPRDDVAVLALRAHDA
jgi:serine phosphatase RsbU (regulator of sigma subunit)